MALQPITSLVKWTSLLGETREQYALAMIQPGGAVYPADGVEWHVTGRRAGTIVFDWTVAAGTLGFDLATGYLTFAATADEITALGAGNIDVTAGGDFPSGATHDVATWRWDLKAAGAVLAGTTRPTPSPQLVQNVIITVPVSDVLVSGDFTTLDAGAVDVADLPEGTYARAGDGSRVMDGETTLLVITAGDDVPAIGRLSDDHERGLYLGAACTNLNPYSAALDLFSVTGTAVVTDGATGPDGVVAKHIETTSGSLGRYRQYIDTVVGRTYTMSAWLASTIGDQTSQMALGHLTYTAIQVELDATFRRFDVSHGDALSAINDAVISPGFDFSASGGLTAGARNVEAGVVQLETGLYPKQHVATSGAAATRGGSSWGVTATRAIDPTTGRLFLYVRLRAEAARTEIGGVAKIALSSTDFIEINSTTGIIRIVVDGVTNTATLPLTWDRDDLVELLIGSGGNVASFAYYRLNEGPAGDLELTGTTQGAWNTATKVYLLSGGANEQVGTFLNKYKTFRAGATSDSDPVIADFDSPRELPDFRADIRGFRNSIPAVDRTNYQQTSSLARVLIRTDAGQLDLDIFSTISGFPNQSMVTAELADGSGAFVSALAYPTFSERTTVRVTLPGSGLRDIWLCNGMTATGSPVLGTWLRHARLVDGTRIEVVPQTVAPAKHLIMYGDSKTVGQGETTTVPPTQGFLGRMRTRFDRNITAIAYGRRSLYNDYIGGAFTALRAEITAAIAASGVAEADTTFLWMGDTNSFGDAAWASRGAYITAGTLFVSNVLADHPAMTVKMFTMTYRADSIYSVGRAPWGGGTGGSDFRDDQTTLGLAGGLSSGDILDGTLTSQSLADGVHEDTDGHEANATYFQATVPE